jgi:hypothetical protein
LSGWFVELACTPRARGFVLVFSDDGGVAVPTSIPFLYNFIILFE